MKLSQVKEILNADVLTCEELMDMEVEDVFGSDLMSDVLAFVSKSTVLVTGLTNIQAVRTADMTDMKCIIFVRGKRPDECTLKLAKEKNICILCTKNIMFTTCGLLYESGLKGAEMK